MEKKPNLGDRIVTSSKSAYALFTDYLWKKHAEGIVSEPEINLVLDEFVKITSASGVPETSDDPVLKPVGTHATHVMKIKLIELHPELADEMRTLGNGGVSR